MIGTKNQTEIIILYISLLYPITAEQEGLIRESDDYGRTLLWASCHYGRSGMVSLLLNHKPKLNQSGGESSTTSLMEAARNGHIDIVSCFYFTKMYR